MSEPTPPTEKLCTRCNELKNLDQFRPRHTGRGHHSWCIPCERASTAARARERDSAARGGVYTCKVCGGTKQPGELAQTRGNVVCTACYERPTCKTCHTAKPRAEFYIRPSGTVFAYTCIPCYKVEHAAIYEARKSKDPRVYMHQHVKDRAKRLGIEFTISIEDIVIPEFCPVRGVKLLPVGLPQAQLDSPSLDRLDASKGYVPGNVRVISLRANNLKGNGTLEEFEGLVRYLREGKGLA